MRNFEENLQQEFQSCVIGTLQTQNNRMSVTELVPAPTPAVEFTMEGAVETQMGSWDPYSHVQNENVQPLQMAIPVENSGIDHLSPYPALFHPNPVATMPGFEAGNSSERSALFPPQNSLNAWNSSKREHTRSPDASVYSDSQYGSNYMQLPHTQSFATPLHQAGHTSETLRIFDLQSQNSMRPASYPMDPSPMPEPYPHFQQRASVTMPTNPDAYHYQYGYRPMLPAPAIPSVPPMCSNYHPQVSLLDTTSSSFSSGSRVTPTYPPSYGDHNIHHYSQATVPYGQGCSQATDPYGHGQHSQQDVASVQLSRSQNMPNQRNAFNFQLHSDTMHGPTTLSSSVTSSQALASRILAGPTEGTSSRNSRNAEVERLLRQVRATEKQLKQVAHECDKANSSQSPSTGQPSAAIRRILDMGATRRIIYSTTPFTITQQNRKGEEEIIYIDTLAKKGHYKPVRRGRRPKRYDRGESSSNRTKAQKGSLGKGKEGRTSQEVHKTLGNVEKEYQHAPAAPRIFINAIYHRNSGEDVPLDPHMRLFIALPDW